MVYVYLAFLYLWPQPLPWESFAIRSPEGYIVRLGAVMGHGFSSAWHPSGMGYPGTQIRLLSPSEQTVKPTATQKLGTSPLTLNLDVLS